MSRNGGSAILLATTVSLSSIAGGLVTALFRSPDIQNLGKGMVARAGEEIQNGVDYVSNSPVIKQIPQWIENKKHDAIKDVCSPHIIKQTQNEIQNNISGARKYVCVRYLSAETNSDPGTRDKSNTALNPDQNNPNSIPFPPKCIDLEKIDEIDEVDEACKEIFNAALLAVKDERRKTANQASQERLEQVSLQAAKKKRRELLTASIAVPTGIMGSIASIAVAHSANYQRNQ